MTIRMESVSACSLEMVSRWIKWSFSSTPAASRQSSSGFSALSTSLLRRDLNRNWMSTAHGSVMVWYCLACRWSWSAWVTSCLYLRPGFEMRIRPWNVLYNVLQLSAAVLMSVNSCIYIFGGDRKNGSFFHLPMKWKQNRPIVLFGKCSPFNRIWNTSKSNSWLRW